MELSLKNPFYKFSKIDEIENLEKYKNNISTFYVVDGQLEFLIDNETVSINAGEGLLISSESEITNLKKSVNTTAFEIISVKNQNDLIQLVDNGYLK